MASEAAHTYHKSKSGMNYYSLDSTSQAQELSFEDGLKDALLAALVNSIAATTANGIGDLTGEGKPLNSFTNKLAHLIAGCAGGALQAGNSGGCAAGGIGAAVGELMAEAIGSGTKGPPSGWNDQNTVYLSGLFGGLAVALAGGDQEQIATANWAGSNAVANNYLNHKQWDDFAKEMSQCSAKASGCSDAEQRAIRDRYQQISAEQNVALANCDKVGNCDQLRAEAAGGTGAMLDMAGQLPIGGAVGNDLGQFTGQQLANDPAYRARVNESLEVVNHCAANPGACDQQALKAASLVLAPLMPLAGVPLTGTSLIAGGSIGALANAGGQLYANGGNLSGVNPVDVAVGGFTGALTYGAGFWSSVFVNAGGAVVTSAASGVHSNAASGSILGAAAGTIVGYPIGAGVERWLNGSINHWSRPTWQDMGLTIQKWVPPSPIPGATGSAFGGVFQEGGNTLVNSSASTNAQPSGGGK